MANVKNGSDLVTIRDYQGLPRDALHSDGHSTQDFPILGSPPPPAQPNANGSYAAEFIARRMEQDENKRLQQQLLSESARRPPPPQQPTSVGTPASTAATAVNGSSLWWQRQPTALGSSPGLPIGATRQSGSQHLQQRSAASQAQAPPSAGLDFVGESALPQGYSRDLEESSRRWLVAEDAYRQQMQSQQIQIQDLRSENERLKKALAAARSMVSVATPQHQDPDSGFTTTQGHNQSSTSSSTDRHWSSAEENYKQQIQELSNELTRLRNECISKAEQLQQYKDELEVVYVENSRLKKRLSAQPVPVDPQTYPDSGVASSQGAHTSSSTVSSSQELSDEVMQTIVFKVQKSREAVDELKGVVRHQTEIIKNFKLLFEKRCKQQGEPSNDVGGADTHLGSELGQTRLQQREDSRQPPQNCRAAVTARSGNSPTAASFATVSPACFSYALQQPGRALPPVGAAPVSAAATRQPQPQPPVTGSGMMSVLTATGGRQAVEQSDQSRSLGPITAGCIGDDGGWVRDSESNGGVGGSRAPQVSPYPSTPAEAYDTTVMRYGTAEQYTLGGLGSADRSTGGRIAPTMVSSSPSSMAAAAVDAASEYSPAPTGTAAAREHRLCPVCNMRFSTTEPLERLQEHILDCEGTSTSPLPATQQQQPMPSLPTSAAGGGAAVEEVGHADERTCPMCNAHFPPELPQREYELHVMSHFEEDYIVAGREPLPSSSN